MTTSQQQKLVLGPDAGEFVQIGPMGARFMFDKQPEGGFSLVEHPIAPRGLAAPMHVHEREDEYSYVLEGEVGVQVRRGRGRTPGSPDLQASRHLARLLERRRRSGATARDHLACRLRALLR